MNLFDILACPVCKGELQRAADRLDCTGCARRYPVVGDVPILLPDPSRPPAPNETDLGVRSGYDPWLHRMVLQSLGDDQVVVEVGCGNMTLDDPCIVRMDVSLTPYVDLVADVHALPFRPSTLDFVFGLAVLEHLRNPFVAAHEIHEALKPGGYVYGEANFVFGYHGYPHHYFNMSLQGLEQTFQEFRPLRVGVAPYQMPSFALQSVLATYLSSFRAERAGDGRFAELLQLVLKHPLHRYDAQIAASEVYRTAAGGYFFGMKQPSPDDTVLPRPIVDVYRRSSELQRRFAAPYDLSAPENLMTWARAEGRDRHPEIAAHFDSVRPFRKRDDARNVDRSAIRNLPPIPDPDAARTIDQPRFEEMEAEVGRALQDLAGGATTAAVRHPLRPSVPQAKAALRSAVRTLRPKLARARVGLARLAGGGRRQEPPLPDPHLIYAVSGTEESSWFLESGAFAATEIRGALERSHIRMDQLGRILDFGCGAGRVLRHWRTLRGPALYGSDYNPELVRWCHANLPFARFAVNPLDGPLSFRGSRFDFVYAFSVFTHLTESQQHYWIEEVKRVLRPGGLFYFTTHGEFYLPYVPAERRDEFRRGGVVVTGEDRAGSNICAAFHPEPYVLSVLAKGLRCLEFAPGRFPQDAYLFQKT
jgi:SAM-dependent methyltransferase/uncharacterized protein YbaR (Trm112 family)